LTGAEGVGPSDEELISRVQKHDNRHAFAVLVRRYQSEIRNTLRRFTRGNEALADDLAQETFVKIHRYIGDFRGESSFRTWIYQVAYRCFLDEQRKHRPDTEEVAEHHLVTEEPHEGEAFMRDFNRAMAMLSDEQRQAVHFSLQRGFAHPEIADIMNLPVGTVKTHILRGRNKLQELLSEWQEENSDEPR
tara:strand:+ start:638 stop:1207 length:570 start_codon:yes stop_codon:yes gene_type:complete